METDERTSSIEPAEVMAKACTHRRPDATREAPALIMVSINWLLRYVRDTTAGSLPTPCRALRNSHHVARAQNGQITGRLQSG